MIITVDGPAASGKSTIARALAAHYQAYYLNSGLLYRALAYVLMEKREYNLETLLFPDPEDLLWARGCCSYSFTKSTGATMCVDGVDVTNSLKSPHMDDATSRLSATVVCREVVLDWQRSFAQQGDIVAEGRDMGSAVFPYADYKFYITASVEVRSMRMAQDLKKRNAFVSNEQVKESIIQRDKRDMDRPVAPLVIPAGAIVIDTSELSVQESVNSMISYIQHAVD